MSASEATAVSVQRKGTMRSAAQRRRVRVAVHRWTRLAIQLVFLVLAPGVFASAFSGVKYLFTQIGSIESVEMTSFVLTLVAMLVFTIVFGRFFCGYACAFGTLGDVVYQLVDALCKKLGVTHPTIPERVMKPLSLLKYVLLATICIACLLGVWAQVSEYSPWVAFAGFTSGSLSSVAPLAFAFLGVIVVCMACSERFFCRCCCPMGAVFSLMPVLSSSSYTRTREHCAKKCGRCQASCPVGIWPDEDAFAHGECISCGRCADTCPLGNVNFVAIEKSLADRSIDRRSRQKAAPKTRETWRLVRGSETPVVIVKAVALLVVFWAIGATRYLPAFPLSFF